MLAAVARLHEADGEEAHWLRRGDGDLDDQPAGVDALRGIDDAVDTQAKGGLRRVASEGAARRAWGLYAKRFAGLAGTNMVITRALVRGKTERATERGR